MGARYRMLFLIRHHSSQCDGRSGSYYVNQFDKTLALSVLSIYSLQKPSINLPDILQSFYLCIVDRVYIYTTYVGV